MNYKKIIIFAFIIIFIVIALYSLSGVLTPYVSFQSAMDSGSYVQVIGKLDKSVAAEHYEGYFTFKLDDKDGTPMNIIYRGTKPLNFDHANQIVALGSFNIQQKIFEAEKILVKCPSKYIKENQ
ncbi:MAG: cytochrome c maturation protein CcmE [Spirochaetota bacterium]|nr:cytochrome c maturation protein CcmE [Spirochaetota bacterium]